MGILTELEEHCATLIRDHHKPREASHWESLLVWTLKYGDPVKAAHYYGFDTLHTKEQIETAITELRTITRKKD